LIDGHVGPAETIWEKENAPSGDTLSFATAALVADGPLVIWLAQAEGNLEYSRRQATGWTKPQPIGGTTARQTGRRYIAAVVDESGVLHCLYAGRLQPPEDYTTGILDGYFPLKLFVTVLDGDKWSNPQCLMSRSRVSTSEIAAIRCGDRVCVLAAIREEAPLGGKSERMGFLATKPSLSDWVYFDDTNRLVLYRDISLARDDAGRFYAAYQASDSTNRPVGSRARIMAFDDGLTWRTARLADEKADYSLVANDASGTVFVYSEVDERGFISARNGREHSVTVSIGDVPRWAKRAFQCIGGGIYLSWVDPASPNRLVVQKIEARTGR